MTGLLLRLLAYVVAAYVAYAALMWFKQTSMMFPRALPETRALRAKLPAGALALDLPSAHGAARIVWLPAPSAAPRAPAIVFFHGNAELVEEMVGDFGAVHAAGAHVLLVEYPGYGGAAGAPSRASLVDAAQAGYDWLAARPEVDPARIVSMGLSIGGAPAAELAAHRKVAALVLLSTFASAADFARAMWLPAFLVRDDFDTRARVAGFDGPVLVVHGRRDEIIPFAHGVALSHASPRASFVALNCGHNDCDHLSNGVVVRFLREQKLLTEPPLAGP